MFRLQEPKAPNFILPMLGIQVIAKGIIIGNKPLATNMI